VIAAAGLLHSAGIKPEKSWRNLEAGTLAHNFAVNAIGPALVAKHFLPLLPRGRRSAFAALSARVSSIGDNRLGGWHGYRASKAALNMLVKTLAIELARTRPGAICVAHLGTADMDLSRPFKQSVAPGRLFTVEAAAAHLLGSGATCSRGQWRLLRVGRANYRILRRSRQTSQPDAACLAQAASAWALRCRPRTGFAAGSSATGCGSGAA
jgi:NAD(P)-dependent dehydrogenase (short-subunit alcohol dehydrogenase family)